MCNLIPWARLAEENHKPEWWNVQWTVYIYICVGWGHELFIDFPSVGLRLHNGGSCVLLYCLGCYLHDLVLNRFFLSILYLQVTVVVAHSILYSIRCCVVTGM